MDETRDSKWWPAETLCEVQPWWCLDYGHTHGGIADGVDGKLDWSLVKIPRTTDIYLKRGWAHPPPERKIVEQKSLLDVAMGIERP